MISQNLPLVNYANGIIMIGVFAAVCVALVVTIVLFMNSGKKE
ncbi:hypothetical protein [Zobellia alginiliquefaciens]|nr:hypothetical protein [Zobellia alginiliquefaciens]